MLFIRSCGEGGKLTVEPLVTDLSQERVGRVRTFS